MQTIDEVKEQCRFVGNETQKQLAYLRLSIVAIAICLVFVGCDSRDRQVLSHKVDSLNLDVSSISQRVKDGERKINDSSEKMMKLDDRLSLVEMTLRRLDGDENVKTRIDRMALALKQIDEIKDRLEKLERANEFIVGQLKGRDNQALPEVSGDHYKKLVDAHNGLVAAFEDMSKKVKQLDDDINSPIGYVSFSPLSWIVELKRKVDDMRSGF